MMRELRRQSDGRPEGHYQRQFFSACNVGEILRYSLGFLPDEVIALGQRHGVTLEYNPPGTSAYRMHGAHTLCVTGVIALNTPSISL